MYNFYKHSPCPYNINTAMYNLEDMYDPYHMCPYCINAQLHKLESLGHFANHSMHSNYEPNYSPKIANKTLARHDSMSELRDYGPQPFVINIDEATRKNNNFRTALWTGNHLQVTLMRINVGEDIGIELHSDTDQFLRIEEGEGIVKMGDSRDNLDFQKRLYDDYAIMIPAGKWHNIINTGPRPLKLYSIYAPPHHPHGTIHQTKAIAQASE